MSQGTYEFHKLMDRETEMKRLIKQAMVLPDTELKMLKSHGLKEGQTILDAACGPGVISCFLGQSLKDIKITGIDINDELLLEAEKECKKRGLNIEFYHGDIYNLPYLDEFDFIYCRFLFQHLNEPQKAMKSLLKALKRGGRLCIVDVDDDWLSIYPKISAYDELYKKAIKYQAQLGGDRKIGRKLRGYLKESGYTNIKAEVLSINSDQIGLKEFISITTGFKKEILQRAGDNSGEEYLKEIWEFSKTEDMFGMVGAFFVSGMKE